MSLGNRNSNSSSNINSNSAEHRRAGRTVSGVCDIRTVTRDSRGVMWPDPYAARRPPRVCAILLVLMGAGAHVQGCGRRACVVTHAWV